MAADINRSMLACPRSAAKSVWERGVGGVGAPKQLFVGSSFYLVLLQVREFSPFHCVC